MSCISVTKVYKTLQGSLVQHVSKMLTVADENTCNNAVNDS